LRLWEQREELRTLEIERLKQAYEAIVHGARDAENWLGG
jgi:hypothetical protein